MDISWTLIISIHVRRLGSSTNLDGSPLSPLSPTVKSLSSSLLSFQPYYILEIPPPVPPSGSLVPSSPPPPTIPRYSALLSMWSASVLDGLGLCELETIGFRSFLCHSYSIVRILVDSLDFLVLEVQELGRLDFFEVS